MADQALKLGPRSNSLLYKTFLEGTKQEQKFKKNEKVWEFESRMLRHQRNAGSRYPAMNIEPFPHARDRIHKEMTPHDRQIRRQWLLDNKFNNERFVGDPRNMFQRWADNSGKRIEGFFKKIGMVKN